MTALSGPQKQLIFDYCIGVCTEQQAQQAQQLIESNPQVANFCEQLTNAFSPLDTIEHEPCPDYLVERTLTRVNNVANQNQQGRVRLDQLIANQQKQPARKSFFRSELGKRLATAALFVIVGGTVITAFNAITVHLRHHAWQNQCQMQLSQIFQGIQNYTGDHDGKMPAVAMAAGDPWWKVGYQGSENYSNTRHIWLLVKGHYVKPKNFVCPGSGEEQGLGLTDEEIQCHNDFPDRNDVTYSLRIRCRKSQSPLTIGREILISDSNPLFEHLPDDYSATLRLRLNEELLKNNSINHNRQGQNVLFSDGSVKFLKTRKAPVSNDDIFTLQNKDLYQGHEFPTCQTDAFLAP